MTTALATPSLRLDGRRALVTGAGRGLGRGFALALAQAGAVVTLASRTESELDDVAAEIRSTGGTADTLVVDVADIDAFGRAMAARPAYHAVVNNAGTTRPADVLEVDPADFDRVMALNVRGTFFAAQAAARAMVRDAVPGSIIMVSSQMGHVGGPRRSLYCASKFAVEGMTKAMALDLAPHRIRVNSLCPTFIETPLTAPFLADPTFRAYVEASIPLGRTGRIEDVMGAAVFLASDAAALMTGSALVIDGGWTAR